LVVPLARPSVSWLHRSVPRDNSPISLDHTYTSYSLQSHHTGRPSRHQLSLPLSSFKPTILFTIILSPTVSESKPKYAFLIPWNRTVSGPGFNGSAFS